MLSENSIQHEAESAPSFGHYSPPTWCQLLIALCQRLPTRSWLGKRLAFIMRKPILLRQQAPIDITSSGLKFRLYPKKNLSDKRLLCTPDLLDGIERTYFAKELPKNAVVFDVGANIGGYGLMLATARKDLKVYCVEADPHIVRRLNLHIEFNSLAKQCHCIQAAASAQNGHVELFLDNQNQGRNSLMEEFVNQEKLSKQTTQSVRVPAYTLQSLMSLNELEKIQLLKMDIEGFELPVLQQFFEQVDKARWPEFIQLEQHRQESNNGAVLLALQVGYHQVFQTRMNTVLKKSI